MSRNLSLQQHTYYSKLHVKAYAGWYYIGRPSPLGNPFVIDRDGDRDAVCDRYEHWFADRVAAGDPVVLDELRRLYRLARNGELVLGCYCAPRRCHGDTIKRFLDQHLG